MRAWLPRYVYQHSATFIALLSEAIHTACEYRQNVIQCLNEAIYINLLTM